MEKQVDKVAVEKPHLVNFTPCRFRAIMHSIKFYVFLDELFYFCWLARSYDAIYI